MKKNQYLVIVFILTIVLVSCENYSDKSPKIKIGFSQSIDNDIWRKSMDHAMEVEASLHPGVSLTIYNANRRAKNQIRDIENMIEQNVDVIIVAPYDGGIDFIIHDEALKQHLKEKYKDWLSPREDGL